MIVRTNALKKLMKEAYAGCGLYVGRVVEQYVIEGGWWTYWVNVKTLDKEIKGEIVRMGGELPEDGTGYRCYKKELPQYEIEARLNPYYVWENALHTVKLTHTYVQRNGDIYNLVETTDGVKMLDRRITDAIKAPDNSDILAGECEAGDPQTDGRLILWENNVSIFGAAVCVPLEEGLESMLKTIGGNLW